MSDEVKAMRESRDRLNMDAHHNRRERDALNAVAKGWINERDLHNSKLRQNLDKANDMKHLREEHNKAVKEYKSEREKWNKVVSKLSIEINSFKKNLRSVPIFRLERQLRALEFRQMTSVLSVDEERDLVKELSSIQDQIKKAEKELMANKKYKQLNEELVKSKQELSKYVKLVEESAEKAQGAHEEMMRLYEECDDFRAKGDDAQANFLKVKVRADEFHKKYVDAVNKIHDLDREISGMMHKDKKTKIEEDEKTVKKEAEIIFEKFKKGEKLSTEDLMTLQKSGYI
jgi:uncharacterized coiled-coil DUF342 family protein